MKKGFSLIELLITVSLIALLAVAAFPSIDKVSEREQLRTTVNEMRNCFLEGKAYAKAPRSAAATAYVVHFDQSGCQLSEQSGQTTVVVNQYRYPSADYQFKDLANSQQLTLSITTNPPYPIVATNSNGQITGSMAGLIITNLKVSPVASTVYLDLRSGIIYQDAL